MLGTPAYGESAQCLLVSQWTTGRTGLIAVAQLCSVGYSLGDAISQLLVPQYKMIFHMGWSLNPDYEHNWFDFGAPGRMTTCEILFVEILLPCQYINLLHILKEKPNFCIHKYLSILDSFPMIVDAARKGIWEYSASLIGKMVCPVMTVVTVMTVACVASGTDSIQ